MPKRNETRKKSDDNGLKNEIPSSWPALVFHIIFNPKLAAAFLGIGLLLYLLARSQGIDIWPPLLQKLGVSTSPSASIIAGSWKYRCTAYGEDYQHGGVCNIVEEAGIYGIEWRLSGHRLWMSQPDSSGQMQKKTLGGNGFFWSTTWGSITDKDTVKFTYSIPIPGESEISGFCYGKIERRNGQADRLVGMFYQLPPAKARYGSIEFQPQDNSDDKDWP